MKNKISGLQWFLLAAVLAAVAWSAILPHDWTTWALEMAPVPIALIALAMTNYRVRFSNFAYVVIAAHMVVLLVGAHYTYERVPLFDWFKEWFGLSRNHYDRLGHFMQGFTPVIVGREIVRKRKLTVPVKWLNFFLICLSMAISSFYEMIEWWTSVWLGSGADAFLGTQGDPWDTQEDMCMAMIGAFVAVGLFYKWQEKHLKGR